MGLVIHSRAIIGNDCIIAQQVTIGGRSKIYDVPRIGDNCVIGANAVVLHDVPDNCVVAGVPASIIKRNIDINNYK